MDFCYPLKDCLCVIAMQQGNNFVEKRYSPTSALVTKLFYLKLYLIVLFHYNLLYF
jgi:hypothetical protein